MTEEKGLSVTRACSAARLSRAAYYRTGIDRVVQDRPIIEALNEIVAVELRWGFWKCYDRLRQMGRQAALRCDNGPEFLSTAFTDWCQVKGIKILYIQPGKPDQNAIIERFNHSFRNEVLDAHIFESVADARDIAEDWLRRYNEIRPHDSLGRLPPAKYREKILAQQSSFKLST